MTQKTSKTDNTKPCPFCGSAAHVDQLATLPNHWVRCSNTKCPASGMETWKTEEAAIEAWNTRIGK